MLTNLHVKNIALIDEIDVEFERGLNIFTGETGAGKSLLLGSIGVPSTALPASCLNHMIFTSVGEVVTRSAAIRSQSLSMRRHCIRV